MAVGPLMSSVALRQVRALPPPGRVVRNDHLARADHVRPAERLCGGDQLGEEYGLVAGGAAAHAGLAALR